MGSSWIRHLVLLCGAYGTLGVRIINCNNNKVEIFEDSPAPVTCGDITSTADVVWRRGDGVNIGECGADGSCGSVLYTDYRLSKSPQSRESQLTLVPDYRRHAGLTVTCQDKGGPSTATCTLVIRRAGNITVVSTTDSQSSAPAVVGPVVGTIAAVVVTAVIVILLVILIRRRRQKLTKTPEKSTKSPPCKDSEFEEHVNVVYDSSDNAGSKGRSGQNYRSRGQGTDSEASRWNKQVFTAQYQDNPSEGYYSEIRDIVTGKTYPQPHQRLSMNPYSN